MSSFKKLRGLNGGKERTEIWKRKKGPGFETGDACQKKLEKNLKTLGTSECNIKGKEIRKGGCLENKIRKKTDQMTNVTRRHVSGGGKGAQSGAGQQIGFDASGTKTYNLR